MTVRTHAVPLLPDNVATKIESCHLLGRGSGVVQLLLMNFRVVRLLLVAAVEGIRSMKRLHSGVSVSIGYKHNNLAVVGRLFGTKEIQSGKQVPYTLLLLCLVYI